MTVMTATGDCDGRDDCERHSAKRAARARRLNWDVEAAAGPQDGTGHMLAARARASGAAANAKGQGKGRSVYSYCQTLPALGCDCLLVMMMMIRWFHTLHGSYATQFRDARVPRGGRPELAPPL